MIKNIEIAKEIASILLDIKAIKLSPNNPFTWASGLRSPIYCDNRVTLSYPEKRGYIKDVIAKTIKDNYPDAEVIAGVATAGIPQGVLVANELNLPFVYIRSSAKDQGMTNKIEGKLDEGKKVVVIEDLVSTGKSSLNAVTALRDANVEVMGMISIFTYGLEIANDNFKVNNCELISLSDYDTMIGMAVANKYVSGDDENSLLLWRKDPQKWSDNVN